MDEDVLTTLKILTIGESGVGKPRLSGSEITLVLLKNHCATKDILTNSSQWVIFQVYFVLGVLMSMCENSQEIRIMKCGAATCVTLCVTLNTLGLHFLI